MWQFTPDGSSGSWSPASILHSHQFEALSRTRQSIYGYGNGLGFALGGLEGASIDPDESWAVPGMVVYNTTSQEWHNVSSQYTESGFATNGAAHFVPSFGPEGLLFVLGGVTGPDMVTSQPELGQYISMANAWMYEPVSQEWHAQQVTGESPVQLASPCVVGVEGESSYEVRNNPQIINHRFVRDPLTCD